MKLFEIFSVSTYVTMPAEFEAVVREYQSMVFRSLAGLVGSREHVEDLAQEVFLRLYRGLEHFRGEARVTTYLYRIIYNVAQDEWKKRKVEQSCTSLDDPDEDWNDRLPSKDCDAEQVLSGQQLGAQLRASMAELSEAERTAMVLFHQEDCTYEQIALVLNVPVNTVRTHLHRGRERLKKLMQDRMKSCRMIAKIRN